jgi:hypothetical protein
VGVLRAIGRYPARTAFRRQEVLAMSLNRRRFLKFLGLAPVAGVAAAAVGRVETDPPGAVLPPTRTGKSAELDRELLDWIHRHNNPVVSVRSGNATENLDDVIYCVSPRESPLASAVGRAEPTQRKLTRTLTRHLNRYVDDFRPRR